MSSPRSDRTALFGSSSVFYDGLHRGSRVIVMRPERPTPGTRTIDEQLIANVAQLPFKDVVNELVDILGLRPTAALGGVLHTKYVRAWQSGANPENALLGLRMRTALQALRLLVMSDGPGVAKLWFFSMNPHLNGDIPAYVLRDASTPERFSEVVRAAHGAATT